MPRLFFRNDDLGWDLAKFARLLDLFARAGHKLNAAAIPLICLEVYDRMTFSTYQHVLEVHAHGLAHLDHEASGKKNEFGPARDCQAVKRDLRQAYELTETTFSGLFFPAFTPPWNRMEMEYMQLLPESGFKLLSRDGDKTAAIAGLTEINIDIDLHTAKVERAWSVELLLEEINTIGHQQETVGIMLHHKHMRDADYVFLQAFLERLTRERIATYFFSELAANQ